MTFKKGDRVRRIRFSYPPRMAVGSEHIVDVGDPDGRKLTVEGLEDWWDAPNFELVKGQPAAPAPQISFSKAMDAARMGARIARAGWNGKDMWACMGEGSPSLPASSFWNRHTRKFAEDNGGSAEVLPYMILKTADNKIVMGWLASQTDMFADDWVVL